MYIYNKTIVHLVATTDWLTIMTTTSKTSHLIIIGVIISRINFNSEICKYFSISNIVFQTHYSYLTSYTFNMLLKKCIRREKVS